jgi:hypothetical protein
VISTVRYGILGRLPTGNHDSIVKVSGMKITSEFGDRKLYVGEGFQKRPVFKVEFIIWITDAVLDSSSFPTDKVIRTVPPTQKFCVKNYIH